MATTVDSVGTASERSGTANKFRDPFLSPRETARHLQIPERTVYHWLRDGAGGTPLIRRAGPEWRMRPSLPFVSVVEAYVLRSLQALGLSTSTIKKVAASVRQEFDTPSALAAKRMATDGVEVVLRCADFAREGDRQRPLREFLDGRLRFISWDSTDAFAERLRLRQYPGMVPVVIDPRFGCGAPVVEATKVPIESVVALWRAGESFESVGYEYDLTPRQVEALCRASGTIA